MVYLEWFTKIYFIGEIVNHECGKCKEEAAVTSDAQIVTTVIEPPLLTRT